MVIVEFILLAPNTLMIWLSIKREKWVYESSNRFFTVVPVEQPNKKPIHRRYTEVKQVGLEVFPVTLDNYYQTFIIIMRFFRSLKGRLKIPITPVTLICISIICRINVIDQLKSTKIFLIGSLKKLKSIRWP